MRTEDLQDMAYSDREIAEKTQTIYSHILKYSDTVDAGNYTALAVSDMELLFTLYDTAFFHGFFTETYDGRVHFRLSNRMTRAGGKTERCRGSDYFVIVLSTYLLFQTFQDVRRDIRVNGVVCHDRLEATMRVFEHELVHVLEYIVYDDSSCLRPRFKRLARNIFGHTDVTHQLVTTEEVADKKCGLHVGDRVSFAYDGQRYDGIISRITKRATVLVKDPAGGFVDIHGTRYAKFYVPLQCLEKKEG
ncbi:MAG: SprT-like domain-containing protein [Thermoplasmatota archaeon]